MVPLLRSHIQFATWPELVVKTRKVQIAQVFLRQNEVENERYLSQLFSFKFVINKSKLQRKL